jgi:hypothetical protein
VLNSATTSGGFRLTNKAAARVKRWLFCLLASCFLSTTAFSAELRIGDESSYALSRHFASLQNTGPGLTLAQVLMQSDQFNAPEPQSVSATNFGLTQDEVWLRLSFKPVCCPNAGCWK